MTASNWVTLICAVLGSGAFTAAISALIAVRREHTVLEKRTEDRDKLEREALMMLTLDSLQARCEIVVRAGKRTNSQSQQIIKQHDLYKALGGDGWAEELFNSAMAQPLC